MGSVQTKESQKRLNGKQLQYGDNVFARGPIPYSDTEVILYWSNGDGIIWYAIFPKEQETEKRTQRHTELRNLTNSTWVSFAVGAAALLALGGAGNKAKRKAFSDHYGVFCLD